MNPKNLDLVSFLNAEFPDADDGDFIMVFFAEGGWHIDRREFHLVGEKEFESVSPRNLLTRSHRPDTKQ